jgi:hypothetical protein
MLLVDGILLVVVVVVILLCWCWWCWAGEGTVSRGDRPEKGIELGIELMVE